MFRFGLFPLSFVISDFLLAMIVLTLGGAYWLQRLLSLEVLADMGAIIVAAHALALTYRQREPARTSVLLAKIIGGNLLAVGIYCAVRSELSGAVSRSTFAAMLGVFAVLQGGWHFWYRRFGGARANTPEYLLWMLVTVASVLLHRPLLTTGSIGAGDAYWYHIMVSDFVSQWREGIFPVFVGQTEFAFNGAINPLRFAPGLQHLAGLIDLVTFRSLPLQAILNLTLLTSLVGGTLTCYGCLRAIEPRAQWLALVFSLLYSMSPGLLALAYQGDLFMSVAAVPYVPVLLYGCWRTITKGDLPGVLTMVGALAALWYFHPPIAFWASMIAALTQLARLPREGGQKRTWIHWSIGLGVFATLSLYCFVSVKTTGIPAYPAYRPVLIENLQLAFAATLKPLSKALVDLGDYQLGWSLWAASMGGLLGLFFLRPRRPAAAFFAGMILLLVFLVPTPLLVKLWTSVPQAVCDITFMWPMQRFYLLLAGLSVFFAFTTLGPFVGRHPRWGVLLVSAFAGSAGWSTFEAAKFRSHAFLSTTPPIQLRQQLLPQNRILTRYAFNPFRTIPSYISHGYIDPLLSNRLLTPGTFAEIISNSSALENDPGTGIVKTEGDFLTTRVDPTQPTLSLEPKLQLEPHRRYLLKFDFAHPEFIGALKLFGTRLSRSYWMPDSAYNTNPITPSRAFASLPGRPHGLTLWTDGKEAEEISLMFFFTAEAPTSEIAKFGRYTLKEFDPTLLPIRVERWASYRAVVKAPSAAYLETPRMFLEGYRARVDGRDVAVSKSPDALVMFPVPTGESRVELSYPGPWLLRIAYFVSLLGWGILLAIALATLGRRWRTN